MNKKLFLCMFAAAGMLFATSCSNDELDVVQSGNEAQVTFSLGLEGGIATRAISDGKSADVLMYAVFDKDGERIETIQKVSKTGVTFPTTENITLAKGQTYKVAFWAQDEDCKAYTVSDNMQVTVNYANNENNENNDETRDAFFKTVEFTVTGSTSIDVELKRPFAQINVGVTQEDWDAAVASGITIEQSSVVIKKAATSLNLLDGTVSGETEVSYSLASIPSDPAILKVDTDGDGNKEEYKWLSMSYILPLETTTGYEKTTLENVAFVFASTGEPIEFNQGLNSVPVQRNWRTNILGKILTGDIQFNITIDPVYDGDIIYPEATGSAQELEMAATFGGTFTQTEDINFGEEGLDIQADFIYNIEDGKTLTSGSAANYGIRVLKGTTTINGGNGNIDSKGGGIGVVNGSNLIFNGGNLDINTTSTSGRYLFYLEGEGSTVTINGGNFDFNKTQNQKRAYIYASPGTVAYVNGGTFGKASTRDGYTDGIMGEGTVIITGGTFGFDPTKWVADGYCVAKVGDNWYVNDINITVKTAEELAAALTKDFKNIKVILNNDIDLPISTLGQITGGSGEYKLGGENTETIEIDLNGKTLNFTTSYMSAIGANNPDATITIKNGTVTSTGNSATTWNINDVTFANCNYVIENVTFNKEVALTNAGKSVTMNDVTINGTGDYYALWISAKGQTVKVDNLKINTSGRGIKIDEQYVDTPAKVTLNISNSTFKTGNKAAVMVKSVEGATINWGDGNDISEVTSDSEFAVWVDEDAKDYANKVVVNGAYVKVEGTGDDIISVGNAQDLKNALNSLVAGNTVVLDQDIDLTNETWEVAAPWQGSSTNVVFDGGGHKIIGLTTNGLQGGLFGKFNSNGNITIKNLTLENVTITGTDADGESAGGALIGWIENHGASTITIENVKVEGIKAQGFKYIGGLIGYNNGNAAMNLVGCSVTGKPDSYINSTYNESGNYKGHVGGLLGLWMKGSLTNCEVKNIVIKHGTVDMTGSSNRAGALVGTKYSGVTVTSATVENVTVDGANATTASLFGPNASQVSDSDKSNVTIK